MFCQVPLVLKMGDEEGPDDSGNQDENHESEKFNLGWLNEVGSTIGNKPDHHENDDQPFCKTLEAVGM